MSQNYQIKLLSVFLVCALTLNLGHEAEGIVLP